jgi:hypothetical protein
LKWDKGQKLPMAFDLHELDENDETNIYDEVKTLISEK